LSGENIDHSLLHCEVARDLWSNILTLYGVEWVMPRTVLELLTSWGALVGYGPANEACQLVHLCLMWCIWRERNTRVFEDVETSMVEIRKRLFNTLYIWIAFPSLLECFYLCRHLKFILCSILLGAFLYTSHISGLCPSALLMN